MAKSPTGTAARAGMPNPASVISITTLVSAKGAAAAPGTPAGGVAAGGTTYRILRTRELDPYDGPVADAAIPSFERPAAPVGDDFQGTARKAAKLSIPNGAPHNFANVQDLIDNLPKESSMLNHHPAITTAATSGRVAEEQRNVRVRAFIYAASREADNDFHLIVGRDPSEPPVYMTMELSALPPHNSPSFNPLSAARTAYKNFFSNHLPGLTYDFYDPPIPIEVEGPLFFDMSHAHSPPSNRPGPPSLHKDMPVIWEVHPISKIVFEP
jgi:hypothetical protein